MQNLVPIGRFSKMVRLSIKALRHYDEVGPAYHAVTGWIQEHGHEVAAPPREVYLTDPQETSDPADFLTEVQFPIR